MARRPRGSIVNRRHLARLERENIQKTYIKYGTIAIVALVILLVISGIVYDRFIVARQPVATVNGEEISTQTFQVRVKYERNNLVNQYNSTLQTAASFGDAQFISFFQNSLDQIYLQLSSSETIGRDVLNTLIEDKLIRQKAAEMGITVTEEDVQNSLEESFGFYGGEQPPTPTSVPTTQATSTLSPLQMTLTAPTATPTLSATLTVSATTEVTTTLSTPTTAPAEAADQPTPTATTIPPTPTPYTSEAFQSDLNESIAAWKTNLGFTEEDLRYLVESFLYRQKLLEALTADLSREEDQVWARHILVQDEITAEEVYNRLLAGEDFAALAAEYSTDTSNASQGGDLGWFGKGVMAEEFETVAFDTPIGEISVPVQTTFGWHLIQVLGHELRSLSASEYDQARETKFQEWLTEQRDLQDPNIQIFDYWANRVPDEPTVQHVDLQSALGLATTEPVVATPEQ